MSSALALKDASPKELVTAVSTQLTDGDFYRRIEKKHKFSIPEDHRKMRERGWMTLHGPASEEKFFESGENYLLMSDMEWYSPKQIAEKEFPDFIEPCVSNLVPFAFIWLDRRGIMRRWKSRELNCSWKRLRDTSN
jgi:hypothetical protein